jgi:hypothetical protein
MPGRTRFDEPYERVELRLRRGLRSHPSVRSALLALADLRPTVAELAPCGGLLINRALMHYDRCISLTVTRLRSAFSHDEIDHMARTIHRDLAIERGASDPQLRHGRVPISVPVGSLVDRYGRKGSRRARGPTDGQVDCAVDALAKSLDRGRRGEPDRLDAGERQAISRVMQFVGRPGYQATERDRRIRPALPTGRTGLEAAGAAKRNAEAANKRGQRQARARATHPEDLRLEDEVAAGRLYRWTQIDFDKLGEYVGQPGVFGVLDPECGIYTDSPPE